MRMGLSKRMVLEVPGLALEVGSAGCGPGHGGRVLGCGGPGSREHPGKSRRPCGGVSGPVGAGRGKGGARRPCG